MDEETVGFLLFLLNHFYLNGSNISITETQLIRNSGELTEFIWKIQGYPVTRL